MNKESYFLASKYRNNNRLAVLLVLDDVNDIVITVNLDCALSSEDETLAFIDTNNNKDIENLLLLKGVAMPTGHYGFSGYCCYPEYRFNLEKIKKEIINNE